MHDPRVPLLRERLQVAGDANDTTYDKALADAVKKFQRQRELSPTGNLNQATVEALNGPRRDRDADIIIANMERWRWLPRDLGKTYVMVNIPDYTLKVMGSGRVVWTTKVVTGKPGTHATPLLTETMKFITVNPTWNVPPSIIYNEYLPALQQDPDRAGAHRPQGRIQSRRQHPHLAAARRRQRARPHPLQLPEQVPGLPARHAGQAPVRQGQARLQPRLHAGREPAEIRRGAAVALAAEGKAGPSGMHRMSGSLRAEHQSRAPIPVNITYQTAFVDDAGKLQIREDVYGRDAAMLALLKTERRVAGCRRRAIRQGTATAVRQAVRSAAAAAERRRG